MKSCIVLLLKAIFAVAKTAFSLVTILITLEAEKFVPLWIESKIYRMELLLSPSAMSSKNLQTRKKCLLEINKEVCVPGEFLSKNLT